MWMLDNRTPFAADRSWQRGPDGGHRWCVAVRATYTLSGEGALQLADVQRPAALLPEYSGEPGRSSLRAEVDVALCKPTTDVILNATAYTPHDRPAAAIDVALRVGPIDKRLRVFGPRTYRRGALGLVASPPEPFVRQPIAYEYAYGGTDTSDPDPARHMIDLRNPVGRGATSRRDTAVGQAAHQLEYPRGTPDQTGPAGFGPLASYWSPRLELQGRYDTAWLEHRRPLLPEDFDPRALQCAPADQQASLRGGEEVELSGLTPAGTCRFRIPRVALALTSRFGRRRVDHPARLCTVLIEPDDERLTLVWQSELAVGATQLEYLDVTEISLNAGGVP